MIYSTRPYLPNKIKLQHYIDKIYASYQLTNYGPLVQELEEKLKNYLGVRHVILVANGTLALQVAYKALELQGSVITTPFSFPATTSSLVWENLQPIFADINPTTWNLNPAEIERVIQADTTAILPTHIFGNPCEVEAIQAIATRYRCKVIYDAAHTFGVKYQNHSLLQWGEISILSFHATKLFHTLEGGALITHDDALAKKIRLLINFGISGPGKIDSLGINAKMNEFEAAMGLAILEDIAYIHHHREKITTIYRERLRGLVDLQKRHDHTTENYAYFPILLKDEATVLRIEQALNTQGIWPRRYFFPSLDTLPYLKKQQPMPIARDIASRILCLPIYSELAENDVRKICHIVSNSV